MARSIVRSSVVGAAATGLSRIAGLGRQMAITSVFGANASADAFLLAFTIPNMMRRFVADEGLTGALIPAVADAEHRDGTQAAHQLANRVLGLLLVVGPLLAIAGAVLAEPIATLMAWGRRNDPVVFPEIVRLTRWMMPFLVFVSLVSYCEGLLNHRDRFFWPKLAPAIVGGCIAAGALLSHRTDPPINALAYGVLVGGVLHLLVCIPPLWTSWGPVRPTWQGWDDQRFRHVVRELVKVVGVGFLAQANILLIRALLTLGPAGTILHYENASRFVDLAQGAVAVAVGSALLPSLSDAVAKQDWARLDQDLTNAVRLVGWILVPAGAALVALAGPSIALVFGHGRFTAADVATTAHALQLLVPFMLAAALIGLVKRAYFALDARTPLLVMAIVGMAITGGLGWALRERAIFGLSIALSVSTWVQLVGYLLWMRTGLGVPVRVGPASKGWVMMAACAVPAVAWALWLTQGWANQAMGELTLRWSGAMVGGGILYLTSTHLVALPETSKVLALLRRRVGH